MKLAACSLLILLLTTTGCVVLAPISLLTLPECDVPPGHKIITDENTAFIQPGITRRIDVMRKLGQSSLEFEDQRIIAYTWEMLYMPLGRLGPYECLPYVLLIAFDGNDRVLRFETKARWPFDTIQEHALKWAQREGLNIPIPPTEFTVTEIPSGQSVIYIYRSARWGPPFYFPLSVTIDSKQVAEITKGRYRAAILAPGFHTISVKPGPSGRLKPYENIKPVPPFSFVALPDTAYYLEVETGSGFGGLDFPLRIRAQDNALPVLKTLERVW